MSDDDRLSEREQLADLVREHMYATVRDGIDWCDGCGADLGEWSRASTADHVADVLLAAGWVSPERHDAEVERERELAEAYSAADTRTAARMATRAVVAEQALARAEGAAEARVAELEREAARLRSQVRLWRDMAQRGIPSDRAEKAEARANGLAADLADAVVRADRAEAVVAEVEALAEELGQSRRVSGWQLEAAKRIRAALSGAPAALAEVKADVWDEGYERGVRDFARDMEPADNPYRQDGA